MANRNASEHSVYFSDRENEYLYHDYETYRTHKIVDVTYIDIPEELILLATFVILSAPIRKILKLYRRVSALVGHKIIMIALGIPYGIINAYYGNVARFASGTKIFPGYLVGIYAPTALFYISHETDYHILGRCWHQILIIGVIRYIIDATVVGLIMSRVIFGDWVLVEDLLFGFIVTPISPFGNMDNMKRLSKFKHIGYLLDNEGILAYIISHIAVKSCLKFILKGTYTTGTIALMCLKYVICAILFGVAIGKIGCYIMAYFRNNAFCAALFTTAITYFSYHIGETYFDISGPLTVLMIGLLLGYDRAKYTETVDKNLEKFWFAAFYICELWLLFMMSSVTVERFIIYADKEIHLMVITYLVTSVIRLGTYILFAPLLSRLGYGLNIRCTLALAMAANKDVLNMLYANQLIYYSQTFHVGTFCVTHVFVCVLISHLFNNNHLNKFLKILGLTEVSIARRTNMDNCVRHIMNKRNRYIALLKTNRYLSDANWAVVDSGTMLKHPYGKPVSRDDAEDAWSNRKAQCPDCERIFFVELTEKEKVHVKREIFYRILKMQKISFIRQVRDGMLSIEANNKLLHAMEIAEDSPSCTINNQQLFKTFHKITTMNFLKRCLSIQSKTRREVLHTPRRAYRRVLFNIVSNMYFEICIYIFIILSCVPVVYEMALSVDENDNEMQYLDISHVFVLFLYWMEFIVKVLAYSWVFINDGLRNYFRPIWNNIDFAIVIFTTVDVCASIVNYFMFGRTRYLPLKYYDTVRSVRLIRLVRLLTIFRGLIPKFVQYIDSRIDVKLALGYDIGKGLILSYEDVTNALDQIIGDSNLQNEVKLQIEELNQQVLDQLLFITKDRPWIAIAVKTKQCIRTVLKNVNDGIQFLRRTGNIDNLENAKIAGIVDRNLERLNQLKQIPPASPKVLFNEILWLNDNNEIIEYMFNVAEVISFEKDETIFEDGQLADGVYLIIEGSVHLSYGSKTDDEYNTFGSSGKIPIIDYLQKLYLDEKVNEVIMRGNTFGELSVLTGRPYSCTIYTDSESGCKCYFLATNFIHEGFRCFSDPVRGLLSQMWKYASLQLSLAIMQDIPVYQLMQENEVKTRLVRSFVPDLSNFRNFIFVDLIEDLILIDGKIMDEITKTIYLAPSYIPRSVRRLVKVTIRDVEEDDENGLSCKILIIPMEDMNEYDVMEKVEETATLVDMFAASLITGTEAAKKSKKRVKKVTKFRHQAVAQKKFFGGLRSQLESIRLFDEEVLMEQLQREAAERKTSIFFTQAQAFKKI